MIGFQNHLSLKKKKKKKLIINGEAGGHCKNLLKIILYKSYAVHLQLTASDMKNLSEKIWCLKVPDVHVFIEKIWCHNLPLNVSTLLEAIDM